MKKGLIPLLCILFSVVLICGTAFAFAAEENPAVKAGEVHDGDLITAGTSVNNEGTIAGDLLFGAQFLSVKGDVEGDIIGFASSSIDISGKVDGNIRAGSDKVYVSSQIERNLMVLGQTVDIADSTVVNRNAYLFGTSINSVGHIKGDTVVYGNNITLGGTLEGDVVINDMQEASQLNLLQGTVIKGKLTYKGVTEYQVPSYIQVGSYEYVKITPADYGQNVPRFDLWQIVRKLFTLLVYYLFALLIYKLFPRFFVRSGDFISAKPMTAAGIGIATLGSLVGGLLLLIILLIITIFIFNASIFFFTGLAFTFLAVLTIIFADIPVSLWLGKSLLRNSTSVAARLAAGLGVVAAVKLVLGLLDNIPGVGALAGVVSFLLNAAIWILGTGSLLRIFYEMGKSANRQALSDENELDSPRVPV